MTYADKYWYAINVAGHFEYEYRKDIAHDAWLRYAKDYNLDLFEVPLTNFKSYCYKVVRTSFYKWYYKERKGSKYLYFDAAELASNIESPHDALIGRDLYEYLKKRLYEDGSIYPGTSKKGNTNVNRLMDVFTLKAQGYFGVDIAEELKISNGLVTRYTKKMSLINPFNGNRLKITRTISKETWDKKVDKEDYELDDENEYMILFRHKESSQGLLVKLPVAKTNPYIK